VQRCGARKLEPRRAAKPAKTRSPFPCSEFTQPASIVAAVVTAASRSKACSRGEISRYRGDWRQGIHCVHVLFPCLQVSPGDARPEARDCVPSSPARSDADVHQGPARLVGLHHYGKSVSGRPKSGCRRGSECCRRRYPSLASNERSGDSLRREENTTISDRTRRDGQRFARRVHACMSWYTKTNDEI